MSKRDILYVDDEADNRLVFEAAFEDDFNVFTASSAVEALALLQTRTLAVVIADQRMPGVSGAELFEVMRSKHPYTKRIMLTGYAETKAVVEAINQGQVYYFIKKPWQRDFVYQVLLRAIEAYDLEMSNVALTDRLAASDRCATLGSYAARIAHEMANQLSMLPLLELIDDRYAADAELTESAHLARQGYERLVQLVGEVKAFVAGPQRALEMQPLRLAALVHELVDYLRYDRLLSGVRVVLEMGEDATILGNKLKLQQVLVNLLKNAAEATRLRADGQVTVTLERESNQAVLTVKDNGPGVPPELLERIWEPFFTTKGAAGTGLGLDISKSIVEVHGGRMQCRSLPGQGAAFAVCLPLPADTQEMTPGALTPTFVPTALPVSIAAAP